MDYSKITDQLYVGTTPSRSDYGELERLGVELVINMRLLRGHGPEGGNSSPNYLRLRTMDHPWVPIPTEALMRGTREALKTMQHGGKVYAHCSRGRHRSVAMAAAILIAQGSTAEQAMELLKRRRAIADPDAAHIKPRILHFEREWRRRAGEAASDASR
jgi:protein tyrosine phosphatase (PTP) superfamily phosphohydrolase (DUF442 family)